MLVEPLLSVAPPLAGFGLLWRPRLALAAWAALLAVAACIALQAGQLVGGAVLVTYAVASAFIAHRAFPER